MANQHLTANEVAELLGIDVKQVYSRLKNGRLKGFKIPPGKYLFPLKQFSVDDTAIETKTPTDNLNKNIIREKIVIEKEVIQNSRHKLKPKKVISRRKRKLQKTILEKADIPFRPIGTHKELDEYIERNNMASREIVRQMRRNIEKIVIRDLYRYFTKKLDDLEARAIARQAKKRPIVKKEDKKWRPIRFISTPMGGMNKRYKKP